MPLPREDVDATTAKFLRDKYAIVGVGETAYIRLEHDDAGASNNRLTQRHARCGTQNLRHRRHAVVSIERLGVSPFVAGDLGIRLDFYTDIFGGGSSTEALIGIAIGVIEAGMCHTVAIYRSMNGFSQVRLERHRRGAAAPISGDAATAAPTAVEPGPELRADLCPATCTTTARRAEQVARVKRGPQQSRLEQSQGLLQDAGHRRRCARHPLGS